MDLNFPETVGGQATAEMVTGEMVELNDGGGESGFCGKEDRERDVQVEEKEISKAGERDSSSGVVVSKRASTRTWSLLATEKIMKLNDEVYDWEYDRKRRRKRESEKIGGTGLGDESEVEETNVEGQKSENVESEDTGLGGEGKGVDENIEGQSVKRKRGRKSKVVKCEDAGLGVEGEKNVEGQGAKRRRGRKRKVVKCEVTGLGVEAEGEEKNVEGQAAKRRPGRKRKVVKSEDSGLGGPSEGNEKSVEDERLQRTLRRTERKNGKREGAGLQVEDKNVEGRSTTQRQGKKSLTDLAAQEVENGRDLFVTVRDDHDNGVDPIGSETHEENGKKNDRNTCHQCKRNDKGEVVWCTKCWRKRYCLICISRWWVNYRWELISD